MFECRLNLNTGEIEPFNLVRGLSPKELERAERQVALLEKIGELDGIASIPEAGNLNADVVEISPTLTRVYLLQGTNKSKLIPFGNDYSFDFDAAGNMLARRKYHSSFIPIDFSGKEGNIRKCTHSHLTDNPYITPTDIATFLLYGHDLYGMKTFSIYSTAFNCYFTYNAETATIVMVDDNDDAIVRRNAEVNQEVVLTLQPLIYYTLYKFLVYHIQVLRFYGFEVLRFCPSPFAIVFHHEFINVK